MAIPDYLSIMLPLLAALGDGRERAAQDLVEELAGRFGLTEAERSQMLPSGRARLFRNRVGWATTYLKKAGLVSQPKRGRVLITEAGRKILSEKPGRIDNACPDEGPGAPGLPRSVWRNKPRAARNARALSAMC